MGRKVERVRAGATWTEELRDKLLSTFRYCTDTGKLFKRGSSRPVGSVTSQRYPQMQWSEFSKHGLCKTQLQHRVIYFMCHGEIPEMLDHINGRRDDNRLDNLRPSNNSHNQLNRHVKVGRDLDLPVGIYRRVRKGRKGIWYELKYENKGLHKSTFLRNKEDALARMKLWRETYG